MLRVIALVNQVLGSYDHQGLKEHKQVSEGLESSPLSSIVAVVKDPHIKLQLSSTVLQCKYP